MGNKFLEIQYIDADLDMRETEINIYYRKETELERKRRYFRVLGVPFLAVTEKLEDGLKEKKDRERYL